MAGWRADILMYHSISDRGGPTSIPEGVFARQMSELAASGLPVVSLDAIADGTMPERAVIITFDDAFQDFATTAWPILEKHGFTATVYVPTGHVGDVEAWKGVLTPPRPLMGWDTIRELAGKGITFASHSISHPDLTTLDDGTLDAELDQSKAALEAELGQPVRHFAPPYGQSDGRVRRAIESRYATSVGTGLGQSDQSTDRHDLMRLEMFYFQSGGHWRRHLAGRGGAYLALRRTLRAVRNALSHPSTRA